MFLKVKHIIFLCLLSCFFSASLAEEISRYELKSGDKIRIVVYGEDDLTLETVINNNTIRYPFLGDIKINNMTVGELEQYITRHLDDDYIISPNVYISILEYRPFYIRGEVRNPGSYPYKLGLTIQKAVSIAGGFTDFAAKNKIFLTHEDDLETKHKVLHSDKVSPGDVITVEESFF